MPASTTDLRVADLMSIDPIAVSVDASIEETEELLREHRISGLPVVDADGRLVGVISLDRPSLSCGPECPGAHPPS